MRLLSCLLFVLGCAVSPIEAIHRQHALNPALLEIKRHATKQEMTLTVMDPVKPLNPTMLGMGSVVLKAGMTLRTVMPIDPKDPNVVKDVPTFFKYPGGTDPSVTYCGKGKFKTTWTTLKDITVYVQAGDYKTVVNDKDLKGIVSSLKEEAETFYWRGDVPKNIEPIACDLGAAECQDVSTAKKYDVKAFNSLLSAEAGKIFAKAKTSCHQLFGLIKVADLAKDKYKYLCNTNFDPSTFNQGISYAAPLLFAYTNQIDGFINSNEIVLFGYPATMNSKFYSPKSWMNLLKLESSEKC